MKNLAIKNTVLYKALFGFIIYFCAQLALAQNTANIDAYDVPQNVIPGQSYNVGIFYRADQSYDFAIDFLDNTGWLGGKRVTLDATPTTSQQYHSISFTIPKNISDANSTFFAIKLLPVGEPWYTFLDERLIPVSVANFETIKPFYPVPLTFIPRVAGAQLHNSESISVNFNEEGLITTHSGEFSGDNTYKLDLSTGAITQTIINEQFNVYSVSTDNPPSLGGSYQAYLKSLNEIKNAAQRLYGVGASSSNVLASRDIVVNYIDSVIAYLETSFQEKATLIGSNTLPIGSTLDLFVEYTATQNRDLIINLFDERKNTLQTVRVSVPAGNDETLIPVEVPATITANSKGWMSVKLVPVGANWTDYVFNDAKEVRYAVFQ